MIPAALMAAICDEAAALARASAAVGVAVTVDPAALLHRNVPLHPPTHWSPNRHCQLVQAADGWIAVNLARNDDRNAVPAWLESPLVVEPWEAVADHVPHKACAVLIERAELLGLPVAQLGEANAAIPTLAAVQRRPKNPPDMTVIDLSALWAGPLCGGLLAQAGLAVTKIEDPARPDPTATSSPEHDHRLNGAKQRIQMALTDAALLDRIAKADIIITSARPHALARLGLTPDALFALNPALIWVAVTAYGFTGPAAMRVGFGDDCAVAGGLVDWQQGRPRFIGDALADPLTGLRAARRVFEALAEGKGGLIDAALAPTAADFATAAGLR